jgi:hypothetical protein
MLHPICEITHFLNWPVLLPISVTENVLGYVPLG